jgi:hemophore-related protein
MVKHITARLVVGSCVVASAWTTGAGVASADPDLNSVIDTTCTYSQAESALKTLSPDDAAAFSDSPMAQTWLHAFLDSPVDQRRQLIQAPEVGQYTSIILGMANTCKNYPAA